MVRLFLFEYKTDSIVLDRLESVDGGVRKAGDERVAVVNAGQNAWHLVTYVSMRGWGHTWKPLQQVLLLFSWLRRLSGWALLAFLPSLRGSLFCSEQTAPLSRVPLLAGGVGGCDSLSLC